MSFPIAYIASSSEKDAALNAVRIAELLPDVKDQAEGCGGCPCKK